MKYFLYMFHCLIDSPGTSPESDIEASMSPYPALMPQNEPMLALYKKLTAVNLPGSSDQDL